MLENSLGIDTLAHHPSTLMHEQRVIVYKGKFLCRTPSWLRWVLVLHWLSLLAWCGFLTVVPSLKVERRL